MTYPTLYNDEVNIPAVMHAMRVDEKTAEQYSLAVENLSSKVKASALPIPVSIS